ncbi:hypothetical protein MRB53_038179 [Persea americana]|nr:hypothetical protein MRB53_038179 [Persea americana]
MATTWTDTNAIMSAEWSSGALTRQAGPATSASMRPVASGACGSQDLLSALPFVRRAANPRDRADVVAYHLYDFLACLNGFGELIDRVSIPDLDVRYDSIRTDRAASRTPLDCNGNGRSRQ